MTVGRKNSLAKRNLQQNQGGVAICREESRERIAQKTHMADSQSLKLTMKYSMESETEVSEEETISGSWEAPSSPELLQIN